MLTRDRAVLPATHTFIHEWNEPSCLYSPTTEHHHTLKFVLFMQSRYTRVTVFRLGKMSGVLQWYWRIDDTVADCDLYTEVCVWFTYVTGQHIQASLQHLATKTGGMHFVSLHCLKKCPFLILINVRNELLFSMWNYNHTHIYIAPLCGGFRGAGEESIREHKSRC